VNNEHFSNDSITLCLLVFEVDISEINLDFQEMIPLNKHLSNHFFQRVYTLAWTTKYKKVDLDSESMARAFFFQVSLPFKSTLFNFFICKMGLKN
jgi:hypothetical protein